MQMVEEVRGVDDRAIDHRLPYPSLYAGFRAVVARHPNRLAARDADRAATYAELEAASGKVAKALLAGGLRKGDRCGVWAINHLDWFIAALGIQACGGVLVPLSTRLKAGEVGDLLRRGEARFLFCDPGFGDYRFAETILAEHLPDLARVVVFGAKPGAAPAEPRAVDWEGFLASGSEISGEALETAIAAVGPDDIADIIFTSGTTGRPKGAPMQHRQSLVACEQLQLAGVPLREGDVYAVTFPFAHNAGYRAGWQFALLYGVYFLAIADPSPASLLEWVRRERITVLPSVPTTITAMLDHCGQGAFDLSCIRLTSVGATSIPVPLIERMIATFGDRSVTTAYGLTEAAGIVTATRPGDSAQTIAHTTGRPLPSLTVRLLDAEHREVPAGEPGEIAVKGPQVLRGYFNDEEATAAAFTADGFLLTGDVGVFDADGNLRITDRIKDMYIVGGFNTYPAEVEQRLRLMPGVADVAVIGVDDARLGQVGHAFVIRRPDGAPASAAEVIAFCRAEMANYKVPRGVTFVDAFPMTSSGKVSKVDLRAIHAAGTA